MSLLVDLGARQSTLVVTTVVTAGDPNSGRNNGHGTYRLGLPFSSDHGVKSTAQPRKQKKNKKDQSLTAVVPFNKGDEVKEAIKEKDLKKRRTKCTGRVSIEKFKIMLAYVQIMALFRTNYSIRWPGAVRALFRAMDFFDFNLVSLVALECMHRSTYYFTFLVSLALPFGFGILLIALKSGGVCRYERKLLAIPRTCVVTGEKLKKFMPREAFQNIRLVATIKALKDAGW